MNIGTIVTDLYQNLGVGIVTEIKKKIVIIEFASKKIAYERLHLNQLVKEVKNENSVD